jgi:hypothetical protein
LTPAGADDEAPPAESTGPRAGRTALFGGSTATAADQEERARCRGAAAEEDGRSGVAGRAAAVTRTGRDRQARKVISAMAQSAPDEINGLTQGDRADIELTASGGDYVVLPEDIYVVEFLNFEDGPEGQFGPSVKLIYAIAEGAYAGEGLDELASLKSGPKAKLRQRAEALRGRTYETGEPLRLVPLFGAKARAVVKIHKTDQGGEFNRIDNLMPMPAPRSAQRVPQGATPAPAAAGDRRF